MNKEQFFEHYCNFFLRNKSNWATVRREGNKLIITNGNYCLG